MNIILGMCYFVTYFLTISIYAFFHVFNPHIGNNSIMSGNVCLGKRHCIVGDLLTKDNKKWSKPKTSELMAKG